MPSQISGHGSGSPVSVASADLFGWLGVDLDVTQPLYEIPLSVGGRFDRTPVFRVELGLRPPDDQPDQPAIVWTLELGARPGWRLPFAVLLGQRGWFDNFATRIDATTSTVELPN